MLVFLKFLPHFGFVLLRMNFAIFIADCKGMSVLDEQFIANLVPLHSVPSESVSAIEYANSFEYTNLKCEKLFEMKL